MIAYILQMLFAALSLCSLAIILVMIIKNMRASRKQWWYLFIPILLLVMAVAYRFDWNENTTSDLYRFFKDFEAIGRYGFSYEMQHADEFAWLWKVIAFVFSGVNNLHWFPVFTTAVDFIIFFYILTEMAEDKGFSAFDVLLCLIVRLCLLPLIMSISASRNTMAYSFFALGIYMYYKHGFKNVGVYLWLLAGVLTHSTVLLGIVIFALSLLVPKCKPILIVFVALGALYGNVIGPMLENSTNEYIQYFVGKWEMYSTIPNEYDIQKTGFIMLGFLPLLIVLLVWYFGRTKSPNKNRVSYILANMAVTLGVSSIMPTLFLRLCYPTAMTMPILWGELKTTQWGRQRNNGIYWLMLIICVLTLFASTRLAWVYELYWFFEL